ncbi:uncharacterized protein LOC123309123 isoform X2 [Coccinella septempunctata]|uniref:uncharacterized protein LOC123309123 isoform X2 n=1 Tax=Coccinella septempunctata TaxID=41139 RepID=UPI001D07F920|nr:uncharacterized protein LOC123309123 isoform X2 [Coccinella septempunctata]
MEECEIYDELWKEIEGKIDVAQDKVINLYLLKNKSCSANRLIEDLNLSGFNDYLLNKYVALNSSSMNRFQNEDYEINWQNLNEDDNYEELLINCSQSPFLTLEMLNELLKINYIDTRHSYWPEMSNKLQDCFSCLDYDLFQKSLKIHYKMTISQNCCIEGYLSLLKATNRIVKGHSLDKFVEVNSPLNSRAMLCIKVILNSELFLLSNIHTSNDKKIEDIIENLFNLFSSEIAIEDEQIAILDLISFMDEKAEWFKYLCLSAFMKPLIWKKLEKYPTLLIFVCKKFLKPLDNILFNFSNDLERSVHSHSCYFLIYFCGIHKDIKEFEVRNQGNKTYNLTQLITLVIYTINNHISSEVRESLKNFILLFFRTNYSFIDHEIMEILFKPFEHIIKDSSLKVISQNIYLFDLIQFTLKNNDKILTEGYLYNRRKYKALFNFGQSRRNILNTNGNFVNLPQLIIDITIMMMRNYINTSEKKHSVDDNTILLLECCEKIYNAHPVFLYNSLTSKFIVNLSSFYKALNNFETTKKEIEVVLNIYNFFLKYHTNLLELFKGESFVINILDSVISSRIEVGSCMIFDNFSNEISIEDKMQVQLHLVTHSFLLSVWCQKNYSEIIVNNLEEETFVELLHFLYGISHSTQLIRMLVYGSQSLDFKMKGVIAIPTMLKFSVQNVRNTLETLIGLLFMRILISNLDGLVMVQASCGLKENLSKVLGEINSDSDSDEEISYTDACSIIRKNLIRYMDCIGYPCYLLNDLNDSAIDLHNFSGLKIYGSKSIHNCEMQRFLQNTRSALHDQSWMHQVKSLFYKYCSEGYKVSVVSEIITNCPKSAKEKFSRSWPDSGKPLPALHSEDLIAIGIIVKCKNLCINVSQLPCINLIWNKYGKKFGGVWLDNFNEHLDVLMAENTTIYTALKMSSFSSKMIVKKWLGQCFFNILDFREICNFLIFSVLCPLEYSVYYMMCLFIHNKSRICRMTHTPSMNNLLNIISLDDFKLSSYLPRINELSTRYKNVIKL